MDACTIIAKNYVAHARVLARSYLQHHPGSAFRVLVIDDTEGFIDPANEPFELVTPAQLDIDHFERMAVTYDVLELSTAVKPWLLRWMLARSRGTGTLYLDPDMRVHAPLTHVFDAVRSHGLVLSPHNLEPMPRDGKRPNEQDILSAGAYNLGFIGIGSGAFADKLLDWWGERLETRLHRRSRARLLRGPALDRSRPRDGGELHAAPRSGLQRGVLEPRGARRDRARRQVVGQRRHAALRVPLLRLRRVPAARAVQAPGPHPALRAPRPGTALRRLRGGADRRRRARGRRLALHLCGDGVRGEARPRRAPAVSRPAAGGHRAGRLHARGRGGVPRGRQRAGDVRRRQRRQPLPGRAPRAPAGSPACLPRSRRR